LWSVSSMQKVWGLILPFSKVNTSSSVRYLFTFDSSVWSLLIFCSSSWILSGFGVFSSFSVMASRMKLLLSPSGILRVSSLYTSIGSLVVTVVCLFMFVLLFCICCGCG